MKTKMIDKFLFLSFLTFFFWGTTLAQQSPDQSRYDNHRLWDPFFYTQHGNQYRSANGTPGPAYWQNRVDYDIKADLDTTDKRITATVKMDYTNNSPDNLSFLWLQLDQNIFRKDSRGTATQDVSGGRFANRKFTEGFEISSVKINGQPQDYLIDDTRMQIRLKDPVEAEGGKTQIEIDYAFTIPEYGTDRMGLLSTENGRIFEIAQWYPRMSVYDDIKGWNTLPYMGAGEFYLEYGDITYEITAPSSMLLVGAGVLQNPKEVLTQKEQSQLEKAEKSDETVMVRSQQDVEEGQRFDQSTLTWKFHMENTRDVAWAASDAFIWDAAKINLPNGETALAQSAYPKESAGDASWGRSTEYTKASIERYSDLWYPFPYKVATNVAGIVHGMEYPGFVFCDYSRGGESLWGVTTHEFGHTWFPMIVGSNERKFAWFDEGLNTFINDEATEWFNGGEYFTENKNQNSANRTFSDAIDPLFTVPEVIKPYSLGVSAYSKPAMALHVLREVVLGRERFDFALRDYAETWAYKHPTPWDFFRFMDNTTGEELSWFWRSWFFTNDKLDQGIQSVEYQDDDPAKGALITLQNLGEMAMPVPIRVEEANGKDSTFTLPVEIWQRGGEWTFLYPSTGKLKSVILNPTKILPDVNPENNTWEEIEEKPVPEGVTADKVVEDYLTAIGGKDNIGNIKDLTVTSSGSIQGQTIKYTRSYIVPDYFKMIVSVPGMDQEVSKILVKGDEVTVEQMGQRMPLDDDDIKENIRQGSVLFPETKYSNGSYDLSLESIVPVNGEEAYKLVITDDHFKTTSYYSVSSGLKLKVVEEQEIQGQPDKSTSSYSDYRDVEGVKFPFSITSDGSGFTVDMKVNKVEVNKGLDKETF